jgi:hypothetical protein
MISSYIVNLGVVTPTTEHSIYEQEYKRINEEFKKKNAVLTGLLTTAEDFISRKIVINEETYNVLVNTIEPLEKQDTKIMNSAQKIMFSDYLSVLKKLQRINARRFAPHQTTSVTMNAFVEQTIIAFQTASVLKDHFIKAARWLNYKIDFFKTQYDDLAQSVIQNLFDSHYTTSIPDEINSISNISTALKKNDNELDTLIDDYLSNSKTRIKTIYDLAEIADQPDMFELLGRIIKRGEILKLNNSLESGLDEPDIEVLNEYIDDKVADSIRSAHDEVENKLTHEFNIEGQVIGPSPSQESVVSDLDPEDSVSQKNPGGGKRKKPHKLTRRDKNKGSTRRRQTRKGKPTRRIKHITKKH